VDGAEHDLGAQGGVRWVASSTLEAFLLRLRIKLPSERWTSP
jgi:hypothetical protein